jgi:hypothetical protein
MSLFSAADTGSRTSAIAGYLSRKSFRTVTAALYCGKVFLSSSSTVRSSVRMRPSVVKTSPKLQVFPAARVA